MPQSRTGWLDWLRRLPSRWDAPVSLFAGAILFFLLPDHVPIQTRALAGWNAAVFIFLALICLSADVMQAGVMGAKDQSTLSYGKTRVLVTVLLACIISVASVGVTLRSVARHRPGSQLHADLSLLSALSCWFLVQAVFALFYARNYFLPATGQPGAARKGLQFPQDETPDFWDFLYFSFTIGICYSTSDVNITSRTLRRAALLQSIISFLFYTLIIGLVINAVLQVI